MNHNDFSDPLTFPLASVSTTIRWIAIKLAHVPFTINLNDFVDVCNMCKSIYIECVFT